MKSHLMRIGKTNPVILLMPLLLATCTGRVDRTLSGVETLLDSLQAEYAPDTRIALWNMNLARSGRSIALNGEVESRVAFLAIEQAMDNRYPGIERHLSLLPEGESDRLVSGVVNNSVANMRREPRSTSELVNQVFLGTPVRIFKKEGDRYLIQVPSGYIGWVSDYEVLPLSREELLNYREAMKIVFTAQYGFSYAEPDETSLPVADLVLGCMLPVLTREKGYYQVRYPDGRIAWVKEEEAVSAEELFTGNEPGEVTGDNINHTALRFNGVPYLWGGISSKGLDCSGLTSVAFWMNGIVVPRDADQQSLAGREITSAYDDTDLVAGDLLFFGRRATDDRPESVTHVAIYMGNSEFIHSSGYRDRVSINSMDSTRENYIDSYPEIFIRAVRILGEADHGFESVHDNEFYREIFNFAP